MRFLDPSLFLVWAPLVLVPIVLYLFRPRPRTVRTTTLPFFKWLAREHQESSWLRRLKHLLSLLLSLLVILALAAALGRLVVAPSAESLQTVVILLDRSASMAAQSSDGTSRLDEAVAQVRHRLAGLSAGVGVVVIAYDRRPEVLLSRSMDRRQVQRALDTVTVRPIEGDADEAMQLARRLARLETPASIWHVTDALEPADRSIDEPSPPKANAEVVDESAKPMPDEKVDVEQLSVTLTEPINVGITAFQLRRLPLERARFDAFVQVHAAAQQSVTANLDIEIDGKLVAPRKLTLEPGGREKLLIPIDARQDVEKVLTLRLSADGDALPLDNVMHARIPKLQPVRVVWISEAPDPFTELALSTLGVDQDLELLQGAPSAWPPKEPANVVILDGWLPEQWPTDVPVIVVNPPRSLGPLHIAAIGSGGLPLPSLRAPGMDHPVLYGVATQRVAVTQTAVLETEGPLEPLWVGSQGPVLMAGQIRDQRVVVLGFSPQRSEQLPLMASYPLLIGNAIYWAAENDIASAQGLNQRTGAVVQLEGNKLTWDSADGARPATVDLVGRSYELDRIGLYRTDADEAGSAALLSTYETLLPGRTPAEQPSSFAGASAAIFRGDLAPLLLWTVLTVLLLESWLYHRSITY